MTTEQKPKEIEPVEQKSVLFYEDELIGVRANDQQVYVSVRHLCDTLGLNQRGQAQRIERTPVLLRGYRTGKIETAGGAQMAGLLRVDLLPLWLAGLSTKAVRPELQQRLERYQDEAAKVLWEAFQEGRLTVSDASVSELLETDSPAAEAYRMLQAMLKLARQQLFLEAQVRTQTSQLSDHEVRIEQLEEILGDARHVITPSQASQISQGVKAVAMALGHHTGRNEYGGVYGEMYRKFEITSYKQLPASRFEEAMAFLNDWLQSLIGDSPF